MEAIVIRDRYKVVQVLRVQEEYAAVRAVDIEDRETPRCLINLYGGSMLHEYAPVYMSLNSRECPAFRDCFLEGGGLAAVFDDCAGVSIDRIFYKGDKWDWRTRLEAAERLLHDVMTMTNLPPEVSCAALLSANVYPNPREKKLSFRFLVPPMAGMNGRELVLLANDQLKKILPRSGWHSQPSELRFLDSVERGKYQTAAALYSGWKNARVEISKEYTEWESQLLVGKCVTAVKRWFARLRRKDAT